SRGQSSSGYEASPDDLIAREPLRDLDHGGVGTIRAMRRILAERHREFLAKRTGRGLRGICCAEHVTVFFDRVLGFEHLHNDRSCRHGFDELAEKWALLMHSIKSLRLLARHPDALLRDDAQSRLFDQRVDRPGEVSLRCIRLQNRKSAFDRHDVPRVKKANIDRRFIADTAGHAKAQLALGTHANSFQSKSPASSARTGSGTIVM